MHAAPPWPITKAGLLREKQMFLDDNAPLLVATVSKPRFKVSKQAEQKTNLTVTTDRKRQQANEPNS